MEGKKIQFMWSFSGIAIIENKVHIEEDLEMYLHEIKGGTEQMMKTQMVYKI